MIIDELFNLLNFIYVFLLDVFISGDLSLFDIKDLEKYGVLIFIFDDNIGMVLRIMFIEECGKFGKFNYVFFFD